MLELGPDHRVALARLVVLEPHHRPELTVQVEDHAVLQIVRRRHARPPLLSAQPPSLEQGGKASDHGKPRRQGAAAGQGAAGLRLRGPAGPPPSPASVTTSFSTASLYAGAGVRWRELMSRPCTTSSKVRVGRYWLSRIPPSDRTDHRIPAASATSGNTRATRSSTKGDGLGTEGAARLAAPFGDRCRIDRAGQPVVLRRARDVLMRRRPAEVGLHGAQGAAGVTDEVSYGPLPQPGPIPRLIRNPSHQTGVRVRRLREVVVAVVLHCHSSLSCSSPPSCSRCK